VIARLRQVSSDRISILRAEHLVGRSTRCDLCIDAEYVSVQHATIRWNGEAWEIRDLGSLNGTQVNGELLTLGKSYPLRKGASIGFGNERESWSLLDDSPPLVMALSLESETAVLPEGDMLAVPSSQSPETVLFRSAQGGWQREEADGTLTSLKDQDRFVTRAGRWLFCCPHVVAPTSSLEERASTRGASLEFEVSLDEEHVEVTLHAPNRRLSLGARACHYLLLTLARHRIEDQAEGFIPSACGWIYVEDLVKKLQISPEQLNLDIFRIRQQFGALGFDNPAGIIERRPRTRQLRLGIAELSERRV
jgi:hypothetical protein